MVTPSEASQARWTRRALTAGQVERVSRSVLSTWLALADLNSARPAREDVPVDEIVSDAALTYVCPIQIKGIAADGFSVAAKYVGLPISLVYVILGSRDGGLESRDATRMVVLTPEVAWGLPQELGLSIDPSIHISYRWPTITKKLAAALEPFTARTPDELSTLLARVAWKQ